MEKLVENEKVLDTKDFIFIQKSLWAALAAPDRRYGYRRLHIANARCKYLAEEEINGRLVSTSGLATAINTRRFVFWTHRRAEM